MVGLDPAIHARPASLANPLTDTVFPIPSQCGLNGVDSRNKSDRDGARVSAREAKRTLGHPQ